MPRIRKKSSNRQTTRDRAKIKNKVSEHHKKVKKGAKKDVTWKSKKKADPGIPNSWPYKDKVLAELAAEKRAMEEAKLARKEANRNPNQHEPEDETPGIQSLHSSSVLTSSTSLPIAKASTSKAVEREADVPDLVDNELTNLQDVLDKADVLLEIVDARDIQGGRCGWVEGLVRDAGGKVVLVVTKTDLVPREAIEQWLPHLPPSTYLFSSSPALPSSGPSTSSTPAQPQIRGRAELLSLFRSLPPSDSEPVIALMGLPNNGKTTLLNSLLAPSAPRYPVAPAVGNGNIAKHPEPTTKAPVEVRLDLGGGKGVRVVDTPGWEVVEDEPENDEEEEEEEEEEGGKWDELEERVAGDLLRRNLGRVDRVKDIGPLAKYIVSRSNAQDLMLAYNVPYFKEGDVEAFLTAVARVNGRVKKHGVVDLDAAARLVVRDWAQGSFPYYSLPPTSTPSTNGTEDQGERPDMTHVLSSMRGRKEMRAGGGKGLIRFRGGEVDTRQIVLDDDYTAMMGLDSDDEEEDDGEGEGEEDEDEVDDDDEDEEEEDGEEEEPFGLASDEGEEVVDLESGPEPSSGSSVQDLGDEDEDDEEEEEEAVEVPVSRKNKRKADPVPSPKMMKKAKRVSFGKDVKGGKGGGWEKEFKGLGKRRR